MAQQGQKPGQSAAIERQRPLPDEVRKVWNGRFVFDLEPCAEIVPENDAQFGAGLGQTEESVAAIAAGMERDVGSLENPEEFEFVGLQPLQEAVERDEASCA
jgi:hypothetical protein